MFFCTRDVLVPTMNQSRFQDTAAEQYTSFKIKARIYLASGGGIKRKSFNSIQCNGNTEVSVPYYCVVRGTDHGGAAGVRRPLALFCLLITERERKM